MKNDTLKQLVTAFCILGIILVCANYRQIEKYAFPGIKAISSMLSEGENAEEESQSLAESETTLSEINAEDKSLRDKKLLYDDNNEVVTMYLTVSRGNKSEGTDHTWEEVNTYSAYYYDERGIDRYKVEGLLQVGDEKGPAKGSLGYGMETPNATVQIRGQTSTRNPQKNYKIELKQNQGDWKGQTTIDLNKHMTDGLRFRNKMGYDLLAGIDQLMGLRTQFVHLYVNDLTDDEDTGFEDYGLYTQVEQLNKTALRAHGLDRTGNLYKVNFFEFYRYEDAIKLSTSTGYNKKEFEKYLEIKGSEDHSKLIAMLDDVNNLSIPIEEVIEKHFDMENLVYWLAFNILTGNYDTQSRNTYLYSPQNLDTWYFYCWDLDVIFRTDENRIKDFTEAGSWEIGVSNYWGNQLFKRCLKSGTFRKELNKAVSDLRDYMSEERLAGMITEYRKVTDQYVYVEPDAEFEPLHPNEYEYVADNLPKLVSWYFRQYLESYNRPMPFYIYTPVVKTDGVEYTWDISYDFEQEDIEYSLTLARNLDFTDVVETYRGNWNTYKGQSLEPGQYFLKVISTNESGYSQDCFDYYSTEDGKVYGCYCFYVGIDGRIRPYTVEE